MFKPKEMALKPEKAGLMPEAQLPLDSYGRFALPTLPPTMLKKRSRLDLDGQSKKDRHLAKMTSLEAQMVKLQARMERERLAMKTEKTETVTLSHSEMAEFAAFKRAKAATEQVSRLQVDAGMDGADSLDKDQ